VGAVSAIPTEILSAPATQEAASVGDSAKRRKTPKWHYVYYVLAAFDVLTVCLGLYLTHSLIEIYTESVQLNRTWAQRALEFSSLSELAAAVDAPGNDVFDSHDPDKEAARMEAALRAFQEKFAKLRRELQANAPAGDAAPLLAQLDGVGAAVDQMGSGGRQIFLHFRAGRHSTAAEHMATLDSRLAGVNASLGQLRLAVDGIQRRNFDAQMRAAERTQRLELGIALLVLLMVGAATFYGHRLARQMQADLAQKERNLKAIAEAQMQRLIALDALKEANQRLEALFRRTLQAEEAQRQHIAHELHEEVAQLLASLKLRLDSMPVSPALRKSLAPHVAEAGQLAENALHRLRHLASDLVPNGMEVLGLQGILPNHLSSWTAGTPLAVHFSEYLSSTRPSPKVELAAYRIAEEAVANAVLHADATELHVTLGYATLGHNAGELNLDIHDDGIGFDVEAARHEAALGNGTGIALMEQRAAVHGGTLKIVSRPGAGTRVIATFPAA
jgi:signal transduction histidine kinase